MTTDFAYLLSYPICGKRIHKVGVALICSILSKYKHRVATRLFLLTLLCVDDIKFDPYYGKKTKSGFSFNRIFSIIDRNRSGAEKVSDQN